MIITVHVYPERDDTHRLLDCSCWCDPDVEWVDQDTGLPYEIPIVTHKAPEGYEQDTGWIAERIGD